MLLPIELLDRSLRNGTKKFREFYLNSTIDPLPLNPRPARRDGGRQFPRAPQHHPRVQIHHHTLHAVQHRRIEHAGVDQVGHRPGLGSGRAGRRRCAIVSGRRGRARGCSSIEGGLGIDRGDASLALGSGVEGKLDGRSVVAVLVGFEQFLEAVGLGEAADEFLGIGEAEPPATPRLGFKCFYS